jgi:hypothetical protein
VKASPPSNQQCPGVPRGWLEAGKAWAPSDSPPLWRTAVRGRACPRAPESRALSLNLRQLVVSSKGRVLREGLVVAHRGPFALLLERAASIGWCAFAPEGSTQHERNDQRLRNTHSAAVREGFFLILRRA